MINNESNRKEIERKEQNNLLARIMECNDGAAAGTVYRVECWISDSDGFGNGQFIRTKAYMGLTMARKCADKFVGGLR